MIGIERGPIEGKKGAVIEATDLVRRGWSLMTSTFS